MDDDDPDTTPERLGICASLVENASDPIAVVDRRYVYRMVNPAFCKVFVRTSDEIIGSTAAQLLGDDVFHYSLLPHFELCLSGESASLQEWFSYPDLGLRFIEVRCHPVRIEGHIVGVASVMKDITDQKMAEDARRDSEDRYLALADSSFLWEQLTDQDGRFIHVSPSCERITGYRADEFLADPNLLEKIAHPDDRALVTRHLREERRIGRAARQVEFRIVHRSGEERWVGHLCQPIFGRNGAWLGWRGSSRELTERKRFEESLAASEERFRQVFVNAPIGIAMAGPDYRFTQANPAFCTMTGYSEEELRELSIEDITHPENLAKSTALLRRLWKGDIHTHVQLEKRYIRKSGEVFRGLLTLTVLRGQNGNPVSSLAMLEDITERWEADQLREQYASFLSHDLKSPLSVVIGQAGSVRKQLIRQGMEPQIKGMDAILRSAWRMNSMITDLAESSGLESGKWTMQKTPTDLGKLVADVCEMVVSPAEYQRLRIEKAEGLPTVEVDQERLERAVANLVTNALKYSPQESPVTMSLEKTEGKVQFSVTDQGKGIPPEQHALIFERFYRAVSRQKAEGLGLGLYITRLIVEAHGGQVWVKSEVGKGSTFGFTIPISHD